MITVSSGMGYVVSVIKCHFFPDGLQLMEVTVTLRESPDPRGR
jgi:hypothetical protein